MEGQGGPVVYHHDVQKAESEVQEREKQLTELFKLAKLLVSSIRTGIRLWCTTVSSRSSTLDMPVTGSSKASQRLPFLQWRR